MIQVSRSQGSIHEETHLKTVQVHIYNWVSKGKTSFLAFDATLRETEIKSQDQRVYLWHAPQFRVDNFLFSTCHLESSVVSSPLASAGEGWRGHILKLKSKPSDSGLERRGRTPGDSKEPAGQTPNSRPTTFLS